MLGDHAFIVPPSSFRVHASLRVPLCPLWLILSRTPPPVYNRARKLQTAGEGWDKRLARTGEKINWRWGALAAALMALLSLVPQAHLCYTRGGEWQGAYAYFYTDEPAYAAYLNALIDGRPRRTDPYVGRDDNGRDDGIHDDPAAAAPLAESLFSIQSAPAYLLALPARLFGLSASIVFILLMPAVAAAASLAIYWLAWSISRDRGLAFAAVFVVLCLGVAVTGQGWVAAAFGLPGGYVFLPFLRRYVPGVPLVFLLLFCGCAWRALTLARRKARLLHAFAAGLLFALQVYSYFYHWTTSAALLACLAAVWIAARPANWRDALAPLALIGAIALASLAPYFALVARRAPSMDAAQALLHTREPDVWRGVILVAVLAAAALIYGARRGLVRPRDPAALFTFSLTLSVVAVFNQQIVTNRSLQPMHYEQYVGNYLALLAAALACGLLWRGHVTRARAADARQGAGDDNGALVAVAAPHVATPRVAAQHVAAPRVPAGGGPHLLPRRVWLTAAAFAFLWGVCETVPPTRNYAALNLMHDDWRAVTRRLDELARDPAFASARGAGAAATPPVVFNPSDTRMDHVPADTACAVVWAPHTFAYSSLTAEENKERVFLFLHFAGVAPAAFAAQGRDQGFLQFNVFGWERANPRLTADYRPVTPAEIERERQNYAAFVRRVEAASAPPAPALSFVVVSDDQPFPSSNLDRFYLRDAGERVGRHTIYRVRAR